MTFCTHVYKWHLVHVRGASAGISTHASTVSEASVHRIHSQGDIFPVGSWARDARGFLGYDVSSLTFSHSEGDRSTLNEWTVKSVCTWPRDFRLPLHVLLRYCETFLRIERRVQHISIVKSWPRYSCLFWIYEILPFSTSKPEWLMTASWRVWAFTR